MVFCKIPLAGEKQKNPFCVQLYSGKFKAKLHSGHTALSYSSRKLVNQTSTRKDILEKDKVEEKGK